VGFQSRHLYAAPNILIRHSTVAIDALPNTFMCASGEAVGTFALESAMDELAQELGMDPIELRMRNEPERDPLAGNRFSLRNLRAAYAIAAERFGWAGRDPQPRSMRADGKLVGWGVATAFHMPIQGPAEVAVRLGVDGSVLVRTALHEIGVGASTAAAQIAADALGVSVDSVAVEYGDTALPPGRWQVGRCRPPRSRRA
jgi:xanthine dehydrogenase YagR molybdenum-binding subunit